MSLLDIIIGSAFLSLVIFTVIYRLVPQMQSESYTQYFEEKDDEQKEWGERDPLDW
jgi:TPP-dependent pyruvate/acetoin dehydrogenase alpha subunit